MTKTMETTAAFVLFIVLLFSFLYPFTRFAHGTISYYILTPLRIKRIMESQGILGPKPRFPLGNISGVSSLVSKSTSGCMNCISHDIVDRLLPHYTIWSKLYGKWFVHWNGFEPRLCLTDPELIKEMLSKYSAVSGKSWLQQEGSKNFIGRGLLMANGDDWYHQRRIVSPAFTGENLKAYAEYVVNCTEEMLECVWNTARSGQAELEIGEYMTRLTAEIISRVVFGTGYEKGKQIIHMLTILQRLCAQASRHLCIPGSRFLPSKYNREIKALKPKLEALLKETIKSRRGSIEIGRASSHGTDILSVLMHEMQKKGDVNLQLVMDECKTFLFAGHETTLLLLTWTIMLLASDPGWQDRVRAEAIRVCDGQAPSVDHLPRLTLLHMVINESLRLYPPASVLPRTAFEDIVLGDLRIPEGLSVWIPVLAVHHSKELWGEDADEFNPARFESKKSSTGSFIPFGLGPRNCIGQSFAMMKAKIILAMFVSRFRFVISKTYRHAPVTVLTIRPKYGVQICLEPLNP